LVIAGQTTANFASVSAGDYEVYAIQFEAAIGMDNLVLGTALADLTSRGCFDLSSSPFTVGVCQNACNLENCDFTAPADITTTFAGGGTDPAFTTEYILVDAIFGLILDVQTTPSFTSVAPGNYLIYAIQYETASGMNNLAAGTAISGLSGDCFDLSTVPFEASVCSETITGCAFTDIDQVKIDFGGSNSSPSLTTEYVLFDS